MKKKELIKELRELHRPWPSGHMQWTNRFGGSMEDTGKDACMSCGSGAEYPCETIQLLNHLTDKAEKPYRVIVDTMSEQYVYELNAKSSVEATAQGLASARGDGMTTYSYWVEASRLDK